MGSFFADRFDLEVVFDEVLLKSHEDFFREFFQHVSDELFAATAGKLSIARVFLMSEGIGPTCPDVELLDSTSDTSTGRLWQSGSGHVPIRYGHVSLPSVGRFVHELGHYLFDLGNEFEGSLESGIDACVPRADQATLDACVMGYVQENDLSAWLQLADDGFGFPVIWADWVSLLKARFNHPLDFAGEMRPAPGDGFTLGHPRRFCWTAAGGGTVHDASETSDQNSDHSESCWETMANDTVHAGLVYGLAAPTSAPVLSVGGPQAELVVVTPTYRFALALDRSGSMQGSKFAALMTGAAYWIDFVSAVRDELAIVSFADAPNSDVPMSAVPASGTAAWRSAAKAAIAPLAAGGNTAIGDALRAALDEIKAGGVTCASPNIVLFSDGLQTTGTEQPDDVLPDLITERVRVFVIGVGLDQDKIVLARLADETRGRSYFFDAAPTDTGTALLIQLKLVEVASLARNNTEMLCLAPFVAAAFSAGSMPSPLPFGLPPGKPPPPLPPAPIFGPTAEVHVWVGESARELVIGALGTQLLHTSGIEILDPDGNDTTALPDARNVGGALRYQFSIVDRPRPGRWTLRVPRSIAEDVGLHAFAFARHDDVRIVIEHPRRVLALDEDARIVIRLLAPRAVAPSEVRVRRRVNGAWLDCPTQSIGDLASFGDLDAAVLAVVPARRSSGPMEIVVDVRRDEGNARYPKHVRCGSDRPELVAGNIDEVRVGQIVLRRSITLLYGDVVPGGHERSAGRASCRAAVHPRQKKLVKAWFRKHRRRKGGGVR